MPEKAYAGDAGFDLFAAKKVVVAGNSVKAVPTGIALEIPKGYFGKIFDRSGLAVNSSLQVKAGVIDSGYRGDVAIVFSNTSYTPFTVEAGTKIAQIVLLPIPEFKLVEVEELSDSDRDTKGFGSSDNSK